MLWAFISPPDNRYLRASVFEQRIWQRNESKRTGTVNTEAFKPMQVPYKFIPINFHLTKFAIEEIQRGTLYASQYFGEAMVPIIFWSEEIAKPGVGWHKRVNVRLDYIQNLDGLDLIFEYEAENNERFAGRTINFIDGSFQFIATDS
jgi:hypothetical protein